MDPLTLAVGAGAGLIGILTGLGPVAAPVAGAAAAAGPLTTLGVAVGAPLAAGSAAATGAGAAGIMSNPYTVQGVQSASADAQNQAVQGAADLINPLNIPGVRINVN